MCLKNVIQTGNCGLLVTVVCAVLERMSAGSVRPGSEVAKNLVSNVMWHELLYNALRPLVKCWYAAILQSHTRPLTVAVLGGELYSLRLCAMSGASSRCGWTRRPPHAEDDYEWGVGQATRGRILWKNLNCGERIRDLELGMSGVCIGQVFFKQCQENQQRMLHLVGVKELRWYKLDHHRRVRYWLYCRNDWEACPLAVGSVCSSWCRQVQLCQITSPTSFLML